MNSYAILIYILKSIFISGVFTGYYWIALRNKNFNYYNRFYLLLSITCSLIIPLFNFTWFTIAKQEIPVIPEQISYIPIQATDNKTTVFPWLSILNYVVIGVSLALLALFALNIFRVYQLKRKSAVLKMDGIDFIYTDLEHAPFSFLKNLFWKESISMDSTYGKKIFKHEITHINQKHTHDILFCQVVNAIFWMNPFNWVIQKELKAIHEFIADKEAIGNNDVEDFARLLLQAHYGNHFLNPTHSFYYSSIKRRLIMLSTTHRTKFSYLRRVLVLPVSFMVVAALSVSASETKASPVETPAAVVDASAVIPKQQNASAPTKQSLKPVVKNDTTPTPAKAKKTDGGLTKIIVSDGKPEMSIFADTIKIIPSSEKVKVLLDAVNKDIEAHPEKIIATGNVSGPYLKPKVDSTAKTGIPFNGLYYYDGNPITAEEVHKLDPGQIKSVHVWKGNDAIKKFGEAGANGVVELFSKKTPDLYNLH